MKEVTLTLLRSCNWSCGYCGISRDEKLSEARLLENVSSVLQRYKDEDVLCINLSGGEPGLLSKPLVLSILRVIARLGPTIHLTVFTNGKGFWIEKLLQRHRAELQTAIASYGFVWHCTESVRKLQRLRLPRFIRSRVFPVAVVTEQDLHYLEDFIRINKHISPKISFVVHNHAGSTAAKVRSLSYMQDILRRHYGSFNIRSLETISFITSGVPSLQVHRNYCKEHLPEKHHVYDLSSGDIVSVPCCIALSCGSTSPCDSCTNYQQFYENALGSYGYTN